MIRVIFYVFMFGCALAMFRFYQIKVEKNKISGK